MFAYDYPLLGFFWTVLMVFIWVAWIILLIRVFSDVFRNHEMSGWAKAFWVIFVVILPFLGVLIYLIANGSGMAKRDMAQAQAAQQQFDSYVRQTAGSSSAADQIATAKGLLDQGTISNEEFEQIKRTALG